MNTHLSQQKNRLLQRWLWLLASCALLLNGCISSTEVKSIVTQSNYEMLLASDPALGVAGLSTNPSSDDKKQIDEAAARIEYFLTQHPDDPAMVSALRLRQGLLYLNHNQFSFAETAFGQVKSDDLHSARDKALYGVKTHLIWWQQTAKMGPAGFFGEKVKAENAMLALLAAATDKKTIPPPDLSDYFLEMRAWIGLKLGLATRDPSSSRDTIQKAVNTWAGTFSATELTLLEAATFKEGEAFDLSTRRVLRAQNLLTKLAFYADEIRKSGQAPLELSFNQPAFQKYYESHPH